MATKQPQQTDGMSYVPSEIRNLLNTYQANPDSYSDRQAVFTKLYSNGGDQRKLAENLATNDNAQGYDGLSKLIMAAYQPSTPQEYALSRLQGAKKKSSNNSVPNTNPTVNNDAGSGQSNTAWNNAGIYGNLPQNSALSFLMNRNK